MKYLLVLLLFISSACSVDFVKVEALTGSWGNENQNTDLIVNRQQAIFNFTCASAIINDDITDYGSQSFNTAGTYMQQFGNIPQDYDPAKYTYAATFKFSRTNDVLRVEILKVADGTTLGIFEYQKNVLVNVKKCP